MIPTLSKYLLDLHPFKFAISSDLNCVHKNLKTIYGDLVGDYDDSIVDYELTIKSTQGLRKFIKPQARFFCDQKEPFKALSHDKAYAFLEWGMNWVIAAHEVQHVIIHSAVLAKGNKAILFPAPPGSGKSTLTAYLAFNGWRLLSDEMALIIPNTTTITPFVRPICLKNQSINIAKDLCLNANFSELAKNTHKGDVIHMSPPKLSWDKRMENAELVAVVFPNFRADINLQIYELNKCQAYMELVKNAFNYSVLRNTAFSTLTKVIDNIKTFEIFHNNLAEVKDFLEQDVL